ncbi:hypothetical protein [Streptomyces sp. NPDC127039]|uniref:hypothetical protein n=1 Tax=Streptomyces sp. NPDC127039 TaxID=3347115 RepID=UPI00365C289F
MDESRLIALVVDAAEASVCSRGALERLAGISSIEAGEVWKSNLLHIYRRRLRRVAIGTELERATQSLISFLENYDRESLLMVSVTIDPEGTEMFLVDSEETRILHWMRMFSR